MQIQASDPTAAKASGDAKSKTSADYMWNVIRFADMMNQARPENATMETTVRSPHLSLAKFSFNAFGDSPMAFQEGARLTDTDHSPEGVARAMARELGDGQQITLEDAMKALQAGKANAEEIITTLFERLDRDRSGALSVAEMQELREYKVAHQDDDPWGAPRLPESWA